MKTTNATTDFASKAMKKEERSALIWNLEMPYRNIGSDVTMGCAISYQKCSWNYLNFTLSALCYKLQSELNLKKAKSWISYLHGYLFIGIRMTLGPGDDSLKTFGNMAHPNVTILIYSRAEYHFH